MAGLFDTLARDWDQLVNQRATRRTYTTWTQDYPVFAAHPDLRTLIGHLRVEQDRQHADRILAALARLAPADTLAGRTLLQAIVPGLRSLSYRHGWLAAPDELETAIVGIAWEHIRRYPITTRPQRIAANLLLDTAHHLRRDLRRDDNTISLGQVSPQLPMAAPNPDPATELTQLIHRALDTGYITDDQAVILLRSRVHHQRINDIAAELSCPPSTIRQRRLRAEASLRAVR